MLPNMAERAAPGGYDATTHEPAGGGVLSPSERARYSALLWGIACLIGILAIVLPHGPTVQSGACLVVAGGAAVAAILELRVRDARPMWVNYLLASLSLVAVNGALVFCHKSPVVFAAGDLFVLTTIFTAFFYPRRAFLVYLIAQAGSSAVVFLHSGVAGAPAGWALVIGITTTVGMVVYVLQGALRRAAITDALTGLVNRRALAPMVGHEIARCERLGHPLCLAVLDLDHFKDVNDRLGHQGGDELLVEVSTMWRAALRAGDVLVRSGGDEFVLILPSTEVTQAVAVLDRLQRGTPQSFSCGLATAVPGTTTEDLLRQADHACYQAKTKARGSLVLSDAAALLHAEGTPGDDHDDRLPPGGSWRARPAAARLLRLLALTVPFATSLAAVLGSNAVLWRPHGWGAFLLLGLVDLAIGVAVAKSVNHLARRLLPLATLFSLSLVFPDQAPSRFGTALKANSTARLRAHIRAGFDDADVAAGAENLLVLLAALSRHDSMTRGHCERVRAFVDLLAAELRLGPADRERLRWAALFHDIGKLKVPGPLLRKPAKPTREEWETLRRHPVEGARLIAPMARWLGQWANAVAEHHERFDGTGYPNGLAGADISLGGRILAVADAYEVMISSRPYSRPVKPEAARRELVACAGAQFDPAVVRAFLSISVGTLRRAIGPLGFLAELPLVGALPRAEALAVVGGRHAANLVGVVTGTGAMVAAGSLGVVHASAPVSSTPPPHTVPLVVSHRPEPAPAATSATESPASPGGAPEAPGVAPDGASSASGAPAPSGGGEPPTTTSTTAPGLDVPLVTGPVLTSGTGLPKLPGS